MATSFLDEDTAQSLDSGRQTLGVVFRTAQKHLQKVFIVFVIGFIGTFWGLRAFVWDWLKAVTESRMDEVTAAQHEIIVQTPFEVILLQAKIGIIVGILISIPPLLFLARHELRDLGYWPQAPIARWKLVVLGTIASGLFVGGVAYAYAFFFPIILGFLASNALGAGVQPTWSIVMWTEFLILLTISFGLAAQLPLAMSALAYAEIVPYETFRDKWRYAVLGIFVFGAIFSPPDPISQIMWAIPLVVLYAASLGLTKMIVTAKRRRSDSPLDMGDPTAIDLSELQAAGLYAAPDEAFLALDEDEALELAQAALDNDDPETAQAVLDRFDQAHETDAPAEEVEETTTSVDEESTSVETEQETEDSSDDDPLFEGGFLGRRASGALSAFSGEKDEDEIGGYLYDIQFIIGSLRSRSFRIMAVFGIVMAATFTFLYQGGLGLIKDDFISRIPAAVQPEEVHIIALHPVEVLIFEIKVSVLVGLLAVIPMITYYAWPAMKDRGFARGNRNVIYAWTLAIFSALAIGTAIGYSIIAPAIISYLVYDALQAGMVISYRINKFAWLIIYTTVGVGILACVPITMWMLYRGGIASYYGMRTRWREVTIAVFVVAGIFTPVSVLTMFLVAIPVMIAYWIGLVGLWLWTLGGRRDWYHTLPDISDA